MQIVAVINFHCQITSSTNTLESAPPSVNGLLTACDGQQISLTCSHDNIDVACGGTLLLASPPVNCVANVAHTAITASPCGPFTFEGITHLELPLPPSLNFTAVANATVTMNGTDIECRGGNAVASVSIGNISLCIIGEL